MINYIVTLLINKLIEHMATITILESQANFTKPAVFVPDLRTGEVWCKRYHCLIGIIRRSLRIMTVKQQNVIKDHDNFKKR